MGKISQIRKRDGRIAPFEPKKIVDAIFRAAKAVGGTNRDEAERLAQKVSDLLEKTLPKGAIPTVEGVQDAVERVLIENGHARTGKAYIIYRQQRAGLRKEKASVLEKEEIDEVDKRFDVNALRVLKARYLRKDEGGKLIETPKELFTRIAVHGTLPNLFYDSQVFDKEAKQEKHRAPETRDYAVHEGVYAIGDYSLNRYHLEAVHRLYKRAARNKQLKVSWDDFLGLLRDGKFDSHAKEIKKFYDIMTMRKFVPNTPAVANFGNPLGMGSACFHPDQLVLSAHGPKRIAEITEGDLVLTHNGRFRRVTERFVRSAPELYEITAHKLPNKTLRVTAEHPILCYEDGKAVWKSASGLAEGDLIALASPAEVRDVETVSVGKITGAPVDTQDRCSYRYRGGKFSAFVHDAKPVTNTIQVDFDLMKLFGYYLAEGCVSRNRCVRFTFAEDEEELCTEVISIMRQKFGVEARIERTNRDDRHWLSLRFHSSILADFFLNVLGTGFNKKKIPTGMLTLPVAKQRGLLLGMLRGDGTVFKNAKAYNSKVVMCNPNLVYAFWQLCMRAGVFPSLKVEAIPRLGTANPVNCTLGSEGSEITSQAFGPQFQAIGLRKKRYIQEAGGRVFTPITKIERVAYGGPVYNLEVEEDHSYVANMVAVHNCFVMDVPDSIDGIMETLKQTAIVFKAGGGMGYNFSKLRPEGDFVSSTGGIASGPLTFMKLFDTMTEVIKQGGIRRGANMGIMNSDHPDIEKFIKAKEGNQALRNFNISILIKPEFWECYEQNKPYPLVNPRTGETVRTVNPRLLFDMVVYQAWESAEPGVIFYDRVNEYNPFLKHLGPIVTTNPCGEVLLYPNESCNLGSVNVWAFAHEDEDGTVSFDWEGLKEAVRLGTRFLDNVIDVNKWPLQAIEDMALNTRKIGLGVMGVGDLLYELRMPYNSEEARTFMGRLMEFVNYYSKAESIELAKERGPMRYNDKSFYPDGKLPFAGFADKKSWHFEWDTIAADLKKHGSRNGFTTVIAPTGSISMIAGCSSGIEPVYSLVFEKNVKVGSFYYIDPVFERFMRKEGLYDEDLLRRIAVNRGSVQQISYIPSGMKQNFVTAMDITPEDHIRALAAFQKWTDSSISKTTNFPAEATVEHMRETYLLAYQLGCKDVTVFRDSSIKEQVLVAPKAEAVKEVALPAYVMAPGPEHAAEHPPAGPMRVRIPPPAVAMDAGTALLPENGAIRRQQMQLPAAAGTDITQCPSCTVDLSVKEGCASCPECGWGLCSSS